MPYIALEKRPQGDSLGCTVEQKQKRMTNSLCLESPLAASSSEPKTFFGSEKLK